MTDEMSTHAGPTAPGSAPYSSELLTFLIADVRGYTRFTYERGDEAAARLADRFASATEDVVGRHGGRVVELRGDEALATFTSARAALRASVELQRRFEEERRTTGLPLLVGVGLDAGEAVPVRDGYRGTPLNLAARLCSLAGPGDVFASEGLIGLTRNLDGLAFLDRGPVELKGFPQPVRVIQVATEGEIPGDLPPLQQLLVAHPNNLPVEPTPFIGRGREIQEVLSLMHRPAARLVTLTGPGGSGKTRLALQVGSALVDEFADGVYFVSLAAVGDAGLMAPTIAQTLQVREEASRPAAEVLQEYLRNKKLLLILDNFEHIREAAADVSALLSVCPGLRVLVTSRAVLNQYGEYAFEVPPLSVPEPGRLPDPASFFQYESVALFVERAQAVKASFEVTPDNADAIAGICRQLDGLPLAIELAAARIRILPPRALLARLESRLSLLTGGFQGRPERQQTLRAAIDWSFGLLEPADRSLFARLSVFVGGCELEAAEAVCTGDGGLGSDVLDSIATLVENSLLRQVGEDEPRFVMLETIREYALEQLREEGTAAQIASRHAQYFLSLGLEADPELRGPEQGMWLRRLEAEHDNLRAALGRFLEGSDPEPGLRLAAALWRFWWVRGHFKEGRGWLERLLATGSGTPAVRAAALSGMANIVWSQGDLDLAESLHRGALELRQAAGDAVGIASSLNNLGLVTEQRGHFEEAAGWYQEGLGVARETGDTWLTALLLGNLGGVMGNQHRYSEATEYGEESLRLWRTIGDRASEGRVLNNLMDVALDAGDYGRAAALQRESLELYRRLDYQENVAFCLEGAARILTAVGRAEEAIHLWGAAETLRETLGQPLPEVNRVDRDASFSEARAQLGENAFQRAWREGRLLATEEAEENALRALASV